jgi:hypothetical protein
MSKAEIRARLQKATHRPISWAEWESLKRSEWFAEYLRGDLGWQDFRGLAEERLNVLRSFYEDTLRGEADTYETETELEAGLLSDPATGQPDAVSSLSKRTFARASALSALNLLRAKERLTPRALISSTIKPRGGVDGTLPQWVIFLAVEAWVPADEVKDAYRAIQQNLLAEKSPPKTRERAFDVARFVWEQDRLNGKRLPWPELWEHWNSMRSVIGRPAERFPSWRTFHTYFSRGEKATRPRYFASEEQLTKQVRTRAKEGAFDSWVSSFRE